MINNAPENIILSVPQQNQINLLETRLFNFQKEITIAKKQLDDLAATFDKTTKEKAYQEELIIDLTNQVAALRVKRDNLAEEVKMSSETLAAHKQQLAADSLVKSAKDRELLERENKLATKEGQLQKDIAEFNIKFAKLTEDQTAVSIAKDAIVKALGYVIWK